MGYQARKNPDGTITLSHETQTFNQSKGGMDIDVHGEITMLAADWADAAQAIIDMATGQQVGSAKQ